MSARELIVRGKQLYSDRKSITTLWQEIAENFYPQRADFTIRREVGEEFAEHLYSSYPLLVHRDLSNSFAAMLRPRAKEWFFVSVDGYDNLSMASKEWLDWATKQQRAAMYDRRAQFIRATSEGDADFAAFPAGSRVQQQATLPIDHVERVLSSDERRAMNQVPFREFSFP